MHAMLPLVPMNCALFEGMRSSKDAAMPKQCSHLPSTLPLASAQDVSANAQFNIITLYLNACVLHELQAVGLQSVASHIALFSTSAIQTGAVASTF